MRTSKDIYKMANGKLLSFDQMTEIPQGATIWSGYDYENQEWVFEGKKDTRTLEELKQARGR